MKYILIRCCCFLVASAILLYACFYFFTTPFPKGSVIVQPNGGLGNQMFQYAAAYSLAKKTNSKLYVVVDKVSEEKGNATSADRNFALGRFNIPSEEIIYKHMIDKKFLKLHQMVHPSCGEEDCAQLKNKIKERFKVTYVDDHNIFEFSKKKNKGILFLNDFVESEIYFEDVKSDILKIFTPKDGENIQSNIERLSDSNAVCVHIRKGDMSRSGYMYFLPIDYQKQAIELAKKILKEPKFFIFSDSPNIAKQELDHLENVTFINGTPWEDFLSMSKCRNNIIANSSFSWWAAYLNQTANHLVIAPYPKHNNAFFQNIFKDDEIRYQKRSLYRNSSYPKNWIMLDYNNLDLNDFTQENTPDKKHEILQNYTPKQINIYTGNSIQLEICEDGGDFFPNICALNNQNSLPTIVTAYYNIKNGEPMDLKWVSNFLKTPFNLVIYTDKEYIDLIKKLRGNLPLILVEKEFKDLYYYQFYHQYQQMYSLDDNKGHSPESYIMQASKAKLVNEAINSNPYHSTFYVWVDIEKFRNNDYTKSGFPSVKFMTQGKMSFFNIGDFTNLDIVNLLVGNDSVRIDSGLLVGDVNSWKIFDVLWDKIIKELMRDHISIRSDQAIIGTIFLRYPQLINLNYPDIRYKGDKSLYSSLYYSNQSE